MSVIQVQGGAAKVENHSNYIYCQQFKQKPVYQRSSNITTQDVMITQITILINRLNGQSRKLQREKGVKCMKRKIQKVI